MCTVHPQNIYSAPQLMLQPYTKLIHFSLSIKNLYTIPYNDITAFSEAYLLFSWLSALGQSNF